jgi:hypothetical protein
MRVFYRSSTLLVTEQIIVVRSETVVSLRPDAIDRFDVVRGFTQVSRRVTLGRLWPAVIASALPALTIANDPTQGQFGPLALLVLLALMAGLVALAVVPRRRRAVYELWGLVGDRRVLLVRGADRRTLKQVRWAVKQAQEVHA